MLAKIQLKGGFEYKLPQAAVPGYPFSSRKEFFEALYKYLDDGNFFEWDYHLLSIAPAEIVAVEITS